MHKPVLCRYIWYNILNQIDGIKSIIEIYLPLLNIFYNMIEKRIHNVPSF